MSDRERAITKALRTRRASLDEPYNAWKGHFEEVRDWIMPTKGRFTISEDRTDSTVNKKIINQSAYFAMRTLQSGLMSGMTSPSRAWFMLEVDGFEETDDAAVKAYLYEARRRMMTVLRNSNIYDLLYSCYGDLALFGTFCGLIVPDFDDVLHGHSFPMGSYRIGTNDKGVVDTMHRDFQMTVGQLVQKFGERKVSRTVLNLFNRNHLNKKITVRHAVEPRKNRNPSSPFAKDRPFASYYWEDGEDTLLAESGFDFNPILAPRWERKEYDPYSASSPGMIALGDARQLQVQEIAKAEAIQLSSKPEMVAAAGFKRAKMKGIPGSVYTMGTDDIQKGGIRPIHAVRPDVAGLLEDIRATTERINRVFFADLFLLTAMSDRREVTATEIAERHEEKLLALGPVLEALDHQLLQPLIESAFSFMQEAGILPEPPEAVQNKPIKVRYVSVLAQAQKQVGMGAIERTLGFAGTAAQVEPSVLDNFNFDELTRDFTDQIGVPPEAMRAMADVEAIREQRAQQQAAATAMEAAQPMAQAAKLISEANARGEATLAEGVGP